MRKSVFTFILVLGLFSGLLPVFSCSASSSPIQVSVRGVNQEILYQSLEQSLGSETEATLGLFTDRVLKNALNQRSLTEYAGSEHGVTSVDHLESAFEKISATEFKAYGWCFEVNGELSKDLANEYLLDGDEKSIVWFYAYAHLVNGSFTSMCTPADHVPHGT